MIFKHMKEITIKEYKDNLFSVMKDEAALLTAGKIDKFNTMTIGWLTAGVIWGKEVVTCYVRPSRYTYQFMEENDLFTVSFYHSDYRRALSYLGSNSGRDEDKVQKIGFNPLSLDDTVSFKEARMVIICKKIYNQAMDETKMQSFGIEKYYARGDYHHFYIGEILKIYIEE